MRMLFVFPVVMIALIVSVRAAIPNIEQISNRPTFPEGLTGMTLVEFYSPDCYHCRAYRRTIQRVAQFIDDNQETLYDMQIRQFSCKGGTYCQRLGLEALPSLRVYLNETPLGALDGTAKAPEIVQWIMEIIRRNQQAINEAMGVTSERTEPSSDSEDRSESSSESEETSEEEDDDDDGANSTTSDPICCSTPSATTSSPRPTPTPTPAPTTISPATPGPITVTPSFISIHTIKPTVTLMTTVTPTPTLPTVTLTLTPMPTPPNFLAPMQ